MSIENKGINGLREVNSLRQVTINRDTSINSTYYSSTSTSTPTKSSSSYTSHQISNRVSSNGINNSELAASSFIVQRVERLYGPGALAQAFYSRFTPTRKQQNVKSHETPELNKLAQENNNDGSKSVPVMKLLRPEFRAQLTLSPKRIFPAECSPSRSPATAAAPLTPSPRPVATTTTASPTSPLSFTHSDKLMKVKDEDTVDKCSFVSVEQVIKPPVDSPSENIKGHHFLQLLDEQVNELELLAESAEKELGSCQSEEGCGVLRAAAGKARLLVAEKLNQFRGLCHKNIKQSKSEDFPTTNEDLAGFWDMVMIQVKDIHKQFENLKKLRENNWQIPELEVEEKRVKNPLSTSSSRPKAGGLAQPTKQVQPSEASKARDAARRQLIQQKRQAMKQKTQSNSQSPEVFFV